MGYESVVSRDRETAPAIALGVHATYMQRVVLVPRIRDHKRPMPFGRVRGHQGDRVWIEWLDRPRTARGPRLVSSVRAQFLAPACAICQERFTEPDETHTHEVDGHRLVLSTTGIRDDGGRPHPVASNAGPSAILGPGGPGALLGITTPHDGPSTLSIRQPSINAVTAGVTEADFLREREEHAVRMHRANINRR